MDHQVNIAIKKIKDIEFFVDEDFVIDNPANTGLRFELKTTFSLEQKTIELIFSAMYVNMPTDNVFMRIKTSNVFIVSEIERFKSSDSDSINFPDNLLVTLLSLSVSHTRALLAKNALGTIFADLYLPIVNPTDLSKQLFGIK